MKRRKPEPGARCERSYVHVIPESVLVIQGMSGGPPSEIVAPEIRHAYEAGQIVRFGSVRRAKEFIAAHPPGTFSFVPADA